MIEKNFVTELVNEWLKESEYFLVGISVSTDSKIVVEIDHKDGVWIEDCEKLSRFIEEHLDREVEDFELEVGSAGLGQPFKVHQQYVNHIGKMVEVMDEGKKIHGLLKSVGENDFTVTVQEKQKQEGKKKAVLVDVDRTYSMKGVKYCKYHFQV